ncbi:MAG: hypothetical protein QM606_07245 [Leucobacter sp.]
MNPFASTTAGGRARQRRHPLAGNGPIVDRARRALRRTAEQFGEVRRSDQTTVEVRTPDGIDLVLSYDPGNFIFSRVYAFTVSTRLPASTAPSGVRLVHRGEQRGGVFVAERGTTPSARSLAQLNAAVAPHLPRIDMVRAKIADEAGGRTLTLSPMGGAFVWVLIPPVFKATAFPQDEPKRILDLIRAVRALGEVELSASSTRTR